MPASPPDSLRRRTRRPRAEREAEILAAARSVFAEHGFAAAAVAEVAKRAGVVEGTVYTYFESKRALLIAVLRNFFDELIAETESDLGAIRGTENRLRFVIRRQLDTFAKDLGLCRVIISEARSDTELYEEAILDLNRRYTGLTLAVIEEGVRNGDLRPDIDPSIIRDLIYGGIEHTVWRFVFSKGAIDLAALSEQLADAVISGIVAEPPAMSRENETVMRLERAVARLESRIEG